MIAETGCWPYSFVVIYKRLMFFHHLIHSKEDRIARKIVVNQMKSGEKKCNWYSGVKEWLDRMDMTDDEEEVKRISKTCWKKEVKEKLGRILEETIEEKRAEMTKLRFTRGHTTQSYISECPMAQVKRIMKVRLNMIDLKANFKGKYKDTVCVACKTETETTEHVIRCEEYKRIVEHSITVEGDLEEKMQDLEWLLKASKAYESIEETRKWLI